MTTAPFAHQTQRVAAFTLLAGIVIMGLKILVYYVTGSAAVLTDALESIINIIAAAIMWYSLWLSSRPPDADHPYGHGKVEFMTLGFEGGMILVSGLLIGIVGIQRLIHPVHLEKLDLGALLLVAVNLLSASLAGIVYLCGRRFNSPVLLADAKHLMTDVASTVGVLISMLLIRITGYDIIDPIAALILAAIILATSWKLLRQSADGLMDRIDPRDQALIQQILADEVASGAIKGFHKVRHRHTGSFHWIDMHLQIDASMTIRQGHDLASRIEFRIEQALGPAKATAHLEPHDPNHPTRPDDPPDITPHKPSTSR